MGKAGWWLVFGASIASIGTAVTGFAHPNPVTLGGFVNPAIRVLLMWIAAVVLQFVMWWALLALRKR